MSAVASNAYTVARPLPIQTFSPFDPKMYLYEYYNHLGPENRELLHFLNHAYASIFTEIDSAELLEFGGGPTIYQLISAANYPVSIEFSDYLGENLKEVQAWLQNRVEQFSWDDFIRYTLVCEKAHTHALAIQQRAQLIRSKIKKLIHCDAKKPDPLGRGYRSLYDIVSVNFVLESITTDMDEWSFLVENVGELVRGKGYLLMCAIMGATYYRVGKHLFPAVPISSDMIQEKLSEQQFSIISTHTIDAEHKETQGYDGIFMVLARKD